MLTNILIVLGCIAALAGGAIVLFAKNPTRSLFGLFITTLFIGILFLLLGGAYLAMVQIIVYAGAILMLFLFVVRYFGMPPKKMKTSLQIPLGIIAVFILFFQILIPVLPMVARGKILNWENPPDPGDVGLVLFQKYLYPFEILSILILVAIVGAIYMAREDSSDEEMEETE